MKRAKRLLATILAVACCFSVVGCGKDDEKKKTTTAFVGKEEIKVTTPAPSDGSDPDALTITGIPEGAETEIEWLSYFDINPAKGSAEKRADLQLFEAYGGSIKYIRTTSLTKFDKLAELVLSGDYPDMFWFENNFPNTCIKDMFQPIDSLVDFDTALWSDVKDYAEIFKLGDKHYVAPISFEAQSVITYDKNIIDTYGLDDPYELFLENEWTWETFEDIMREWVNLGDEETPHYGINGWIQSHLVYTTGKTLVSRDEETGLFVSNIEDPDIERAENFMYELAKDELYIGGWIGDAESAFKQNILFYAMGTWASIDTHTPKEGDNWRKVPMPRDPNADEHYISVSPSAYMWVKGSTKSDAMKCWLECAKIVNTDESYKQANKDKFFLNNPYWSEEDYDLVNNVLLSDEFNRVYDLSYGLTDMLSNNDAAQNDTKEAVINYVYNSVCKFDYETNEQTTWAQLKNEYKTVIQNELDIFNKELTNYLEKNS